MVIRIGLGVYLVREPSMAVSGRTATENTSPFTAC